MSRRLPRLRTTLVGLTAMALVAAPGCDLPSGIQEDDQSQEVLFEDRPDRQPDDYDRNVGDTVEVENFEATVKSAEFRQGFSETEQAGYVVAEVEVTYVGPGKREPSKFHWQLLTPSGDLRNFVQVTGVEQLVEDELGRDQTVAGTIVFTVGGEKGDFFLVFQPIKEAGRRRGVWGPINVA